MKKIIFICLAICFFSGNIWAQSSDDSLSKVKLSLSVNHSTGLNYFGRTDSIKSSGFFPMLQLDFGKHLYARASAIFSYSKNADPLYNGTVVQAGYQFNEKNKWLGDLYFAKIIYDDKSTLVQSAIKSQAGFNLSFLNNYLNLNGGVDMKFSDHTDYGATGSVDHLFRAINKPGKMLLIDPFVALYAGTQNFSYTYETRQNQLFDIIQPGRTSTTTVNNFNILAYEVGLPVVGVLGKFQLTVTPAYIMPQNLLEVPGRPDLSERGENMFYLSSGLKYSFGR